MQSVLRNKLSGVLQYGKHFLKAHRSGHGVHSPFVYRLCEEVFHNMAEFYEFTELQRLRHELLRNKNYISVKDFGAGSRHFKLPERRIKAIAKHGISQDKKSRLLFRLINHFNCKVNIELGSSLGLNAIYLGLANKKAQVYSLEGDPSLAAFAKEFAEKYGPGNIQILEGEFESVLPGLLDKLKLFDFAFVDGNHRYDATMNYFNVLLRHCHSNSIIVFDDIYWSEEMTRAWKEIEKHPEVKLSIDLFHLGIVFFREEQLSKSTFRIWI